MSRCYISGPMEGLPEDNHPAFFAAERQLKRDGWEVINPALLDKIDEPPNGMSRAQSRRFFMDRDLNLIISEMWAEFGDTIFTLPGWTQSPGALAEVALGLSLGMRVRPYREERK